MAEDCNASMAMRPRGMASMTAVGASIAIIIMSQSMHIHRAPHSFLEYKNYILPLNDHQPLY